MRFAIPAALALAALALPAAAEDLTLVAKVTRNGAPQATATSYISADKIRTAQGDGQESILDLKTGQMTVIDGRAKTYFVITLDDLAQMKARLEQQMNSPEMKRAQDQMKNLPPDIQKRMEAAMGGAASFTVQKTGATRKIAGYTCETWTITMGQFSKTEECLTNDLALPPQTWTAFRDFADSMRSATAAMGPMAKGIADMQQKMKAMTGFPLATSVTTSVIGHTTSSATEVTEVRKGPIPASAWEIPAGYKKIDSPMMKGMAPGRR